MEKSDSKSKHILSIRRAALLEIIIFFVLVMLIDVFLGSGNRFFDISPHPFWIIILLITVQYGANEGLISALISTALLLTYNLPEQHFSENMYDYLLRTIFHPLLWLGAAVVLGQIRERHKAMEKRLRKRLGRSKKREESLEDAYDKQKEIKEMLEVRLAGQMRGTYSAYEALKSIEALDEKAVLSGVESMINTVMSPHKFSIYGLGNFGFEPITSVGWDGNENYSSHFAPDSAIYKEIVGRRRMLCCINEEDAELLGDEGIMAAPLIDPATKKIYGMLKIEELDFTDLTLGNVETFRVLSELIGMSCVNAEKFRNAQENSMIDFENELPSHGLFLKQEDLVQTLRIESDAKASIIEVSLTRAANFSKEQRYDIARKFAEIVRGTCPSATKLFSGRRSGMELLVLLPNISLAEAKEYSVKLYEVIQRGDNEDLRKAAFVFGVKRVEKLNTPVEGSYTDRRNEEDAGDNV